MANDDEVFDKHWARKYILDPLTAPEPSQETGPGSSHYNPHLRNVRPASISLARPNSRMITHSASQSSQSSLSESSKSPSTRRQSYRQSEPCSHFARRASVALETHVEDGSSSLVTPPRSPKPSDSGVAAALSALTATSHTQSHSRDQRRESYSSSQSHSKHHSNKSRSRNSILLEQRYPGDLTHRPLDMIQRHTRAADWRHRKRYPETDTIDRLDTIGPAYHHDGPFDATLASRNLNKRYSPLEAVRESNLAALRATPREFIVDSLIHHRPLHGTATIPNGAVDAHGNIMNYEEGADLMREPDAAGGAYKRYDFIHYHPDDLKGKGEPSFTIERDLNKNKASRDTYEMVNQPLMAKSLRRKSVPTNFASRTDAVGSHEDRNRQSCLSRQNSTGRSFSAGLKRRFGSLGRRKSPTPDL